MKVSIALVLVTLAGALDQAFGEKFLRYVIDERHTLESVVRILGKPLDAMTSYSAPLRRAYGPHVYALLAGTNHKDDKVFLNQYSANDLIALNEWDVNDCNNEGLEKRRESCERFSTKARTEDYGSHRDSTEESTKVALGYYCWAIIDDIERRCPVVEVQHELGADEQLIADFKNKIEKAAKKPLARLIENTLLGDLASPLIFKKTLNKQEATTRDALEHACSIVVDGLGKPGVQLEQPWSDYLPLCTEIISSKKYGKQ